jgi:hypothetical protein
LVIGHSGCWFLVSGCWFLVSGYWLLVAGSGFVRPSPPLTLQELAGLSIWSLVIGQLVIDN